MAINEYCFVLSENSIGCEYVLHTASISY